MLLPPREARTDKWTISVQNPAPSILQSRVVGYIDLQCVRVVWESFDAIVDAQTPMQTFHDWAGITGYTPDVRTQYVAWSRARRKHFKGVHILVTSRVVAMGVTVANLALGYLTAYNDRAKFEKARADALARARGNPA